MAPSDANFRIAEGIVNMYNPVIPRFFRPIFSQIVISIMDSVADGPRLPEPNSSITSAILFALRARSFSVEYCMLPGYSPPERIPAKQKWLDTCHLLDDAALVTGGDLLPCMLGRWVCRTGRLVSWVRWARCGEGA